MMENKTKSICFLLPGLGRKPQGGFKVVYEYANRISEKGWNVGIIYSYPKEGKGVFNLIKYIYRTVFHRFFKLYKKNTWFTLDSKIKKFLLPENNLKYLPKECKRYDFFCATALETAFLVDSMDFVKKSKKFYLIQDFENWGTTDERVYESYKLGLTNIVISDGLKEIVDSHSKTESKLIYNGFDFEYFKLTVPVEKRQKFNISMLYHLDERKRCEDSFKALDIVKKRFPELKVNIFGVPSRPSFLPDWYLYSQRPNKEKHNAIYNNSAFFVAASRAEGFGLTPAEAMICGCAVVCTDVFFYAKNEKNALTCPAMKPEKLAENICHLIEDDVFRIQIAKSGNNYIKQFTWEKSVGKFIKLLEQKK